MCFCQRFGCIDYMSLIDNAEMISVVKKRHVHFNKDVAPFRFDMSFLLSQEGLKLNYAADCALFITVC